MRRTHKHSWFEVWTGTYLTNVNNRTDEDKDVVVLQVEPGAAANTPDNDGFYIVELLDTAKVAEVEAQNRQSLVGICGEVLKNGRD